MKVHEASSAAGIVPLDPVFLHEGNDCDVVDLGSSVQLTLKAGWNMSCARLARKFGVQSLDASKIWGWQDNSIAFLDQLPGLRSVVIGAAHKLDWRPLERQADLESLRVYSDVDEQNDLDFTRLQRLSKCAVKWIPQFDSIRHCPRLRSLEVFSSDNLRDLDLRELTDLEELHLESCANIGRIILAEQTRIRSLRVSNCPKLQLDLKRFVRDLEDLWLQGKVAYRLDELALAKLLKRVTFTFVKTKGRIPPFMEQLPCLIDGVAAGTRLSEPDQQIMSTFAARRRKELEARKKKEADET